MDLRPIIKEVGRGAHGARALPEDIAEQLFGAMLDGEVAELELGAILLAYRIKGETAAELRGFARALAARTAQLDQPDLVVPVRAQVGEAEGRVLLALDVLQARERDDGLQAALLA